ncbi:unnamed protein product, partial [Didymodactylos carnosus]
MQLYRKKKDMNATDAIANFPKMNFDRLQELTLGKYQLKQAQAYTTKHLNDDGSVLVKAGTANVRTAVVLSAAAHIQRRLYIIWPLQDTIRIIYNPDRP